VNIEHLKRFVAVAETLSFSKAAKQLYIGQPGLSQSIAKLEKVIGIKLLERTRQTVKLTNAGIVFYREAKKILDDLDQVVNKVRRESNFYRGNLKIGFLPTLGVKYLPQWVINFSRQYPEIKISTILYTEANIHKALRNREIDLAYARFFPGMDDLEIQWHDVYTESASFIVNEDHPYASQERVSFSLLCREPLILMDKNTAAEWYKFIMNHYQAKSIEPHIAGLVLRLDELFSRVGCGAGISIEPSCAVLQKPPNIKFIEIEEREFCFMVGLAWVKNNPNHGVKLFVDFVKNFSPN
jgi:DNA-binding transcriptional LysR family regulator